MTEPRPLGTVAVTGAHGYLGSRLTSRLEDSGYRVRRLTSSPSSPDDVLFELTRAPGQDALDGVGALVHCAYDFGPRDWEEIKRVNIAGSQRLLDEAAAQGLQTVVYISSTSAFPGAPSLYGRAKLAIEQRAIETGAHVLRPGMIFGANAGGVYGRIREAVASHRAIPVLAAPGRLQLVHEADLCRLVVDLCECQAGPPCGPRVAAGTARHSMGDLARTLASATGRSSLMVPVPWRPVWLLLRAAEGLGARPSTRSDSVRSLAALVHQQPRPEDVGRFRAFTARTALEAC